MHKPSFLRRTVFAIAAISLNACSLLPSSSADFRSMEFATQTPAMISTAWRQGADVWIVPAKGCFVERADIQGQKLALVVDGSYLKVANAPAEFTLRINGVDQPIAFKPRP
jgi:hypothetical protein